MDSLIYSLNATIPIFAIIFLSYLLKKRGFFPDGFAEGADKIIFKVFLPVLLFKDIAAGRITETFDLKFFLFCAISTTVYFFAIWAGAEFFLKDKTMIGAFTQGAFRGSLAVLGVAFIQNIYGHAGLAPLMIVATVPLYNIYAVLVLTTQGAFRGSLAVLGVAFIQNIYGHAGLAPLMIVATVPLYNIYAVLVLTVRSNSVHSGAGMLRTTIKGIVTNPIILGILCGLPFSLLEIEFPAMIGKTIDLLSAPATPLALVSIGAGFEGAKAIQKLKPTLAASFIKLVLLPCIFLPIACLLGFRDQALVAILIMTGAPSTVTCYIMAKNMGGDAVLSSSIVVMTTALSAFTMTAALYFMRTIGVI